MLTLDKHSRVPLYKQIEEQIMLLIRLGVYQPDALLPSIREVAAQASLNFNTVKKAFANLESLGVIYTTPGKGSFVSGRALENRQLQETAVSQLTHALQSALAKGVPLEEVLNLAQRVYQHQISNQNEEL